MPPLHRPQRTAELFAARFGPQPVSTQQALESGLTRAALDAAVQRGLLTRPRRGVLALPPPGPTAERSGLLAASAQDGAQVVAALSAARQVVGAGCVVTDDAAALLHGLPRPRARFPEEICFATDGAAFIGPGVRIRTTPIPPEHRTVVDGIPVTTLERTAIDLARGCSLPSALIPLDACARRIIAATTGAEGNSLRCHVHEPSMRSHARDTLHRALRECFGWAGTVVVRQAIDLVEPASESPTESRSRGWFLVAGIRGLRYGVPIAVGGGTYWADFCSPEHRVIGEADGWSKYGGTPEEHRRTLTAERERQTRIETEGWRFARWTSIESERTVVTRMRNALAR